MKNLKSKIDSLSALLLEFVKDISKLTNSLIIVTLIKSRYHPLKDRYLLKILVFIIIFF